MSQESNIELEIEIDNETDEYLANIDFHMIDAALFLQQEDMSAEKTDNETVILPNESVVKNTANENVQNPRFVPSNTELIDKFLEDGLNKNTKTKTDQDIKLFQEFLTSVNENRSILDIPAEELSVHVSNFIYAVRKKDGQEYEPNSLISKFQSIQRYLNMNEYSCSLNKDQVFRKCKQVLKSKTKHLKSQGKGNNPHAAAAITSEDIEKFYEADQLGCKNPRALQNSMWYVCTNFFGMRTGTEVHSLCWGDIQLKSDDDGIEYLLYSQERQTKTRTGADPRDIRKIKPRAYEIPENPARCPVALYKKFAERRPSTMLEPDSPFFLTVASNQPQATNVSTSAGNSSPRGYHNISHQHTPSYITQQPVFPSSTADNVYGNRPQSFGQFPPAPRTPYDFLGGFFSGNQISGNINVHFHTSSMSNTSNSNVQAIMNSPPVCKRRRILPIDSDSE